MLKLIRSNYQIIYLLSSLKIIRAIYLSSLNIFKYEQIKSLDSLESIYAYKMYSHASFILLLIMHSLCVDKQGIYENNRKLEFENLLI